VCVPSAVTEDLILDGEGDPDAVFVFRSTSTTTVAGYVNIILRNGANADNIYWLCGTVFIQAAFTHIIGNIFAMSITLAFDTNILGRLYSYGTSITLSSSVIGD